jgi:hypothetical protein
MKSIRLAYLEMNISEIGLMSETHPVGAAIFNGDSILVDEKGETAGELHDHGIVGALYKLIK